MTVVILVPGILTPGRIRFAPLVAAIGSADCEVKELEVYAGSQVPDDYSLQMEVDGLDRFASERGLERFHLYGFSIGGSIALAYVAEHGSRVASLALDEPATDFTDDDRKAMAAEGTDRLADLPPGERMKLFMQTMTRPGVNLAPPPPSRPALRWLCVLLASRRCCCPSGTTRSTSPSCAPTPARCTSATEA